MLFKNFSDEYIPQIDSFINNFFNEKIINANADFMKSMYRDLQEYCSRPGKRIRPLLLLLSFQSFSSKKNELENQEIVKFASVVEMMHSMLLLQDDIIDKSDTRRGGKALHLITDEKYSLHSFSESIGENVSIVLADVLFSNCIEIVADSKINSVVKNEFLKIFSKTYEKTAWGQILDIIYSSPKKIDSSENIPAQISKMKTAYYTIYYPILMGAILAGVTNKEIFKNIERFSLPLGVAFQIRDDYLGVFGKKVDMSKSVNSDLLEGKFTLLIQKTFDLLSKEEQNKFVEIFTLQNKQKEDLDYLRNIIVKSGAPVSLLDEHKKLILEAKEQFIAFEISEKHRAIFLGVISIIENIDKMD